MKKLKLLMILLPVSMLLSNCQKEEMDMITFDQPTVPEHFFEYNYVSSANLNVKVSGQKSQIKISGTEENLSGDNYSQLIEEVRQCFADHPAICQNIERKLGLPMWDQTNEHVLPDGLLALIPVAGEESEHVEGIIFAYFSNNSRKLLFHFAERGKLERYPANPTYIGDMKKPDRLFVIAQFLLFDQLVFNSTDCELLNQFKELIGSDSTKLKSAITNCYWELTYTIHYYWYSTYVGNQLVKTTFSYATYEYEYSYYCTTIVTSDSYLGTDDSDGGGGGSAPGPGENANGPVTTTLDRIKNQNKLNASQTQSLESALNSLIGEHCLIESVYNSLVNNGFKINFEMRDDGYPAVFNPSSNTISFQNNSAINSENLKEELFHAWQDAYYPGGTAQYMINGRVNIEFEAGLFKDISKSKDVYCCYLFRFGVVPDILSNNYYYWIQSLRPNATNISDLEYDYWLKIFNQYYPIYGSKINDNLKSPSALKKIITSSKCY